MSSKPNNRFLLLGINQHCAVLACADCKAEFGFTALDTFSVIQEELAAHECDDLEPTPYEPIEDNYREDEELISPTTF